VTIPLAGIRRAFASEDKMDSRRRLRNFARRISFALFVAIAAAVMPAAADQMPAAPDDGSANTQGGLLDTRTRILHVTTLAESGPGSLRAAVEAKGARVIVFDVGGRIDLTKDMIIKSPMITIAGQTAPAPGISLWGASVRVRTHDVIIQHIAIRPGPGATPKINNNRDGISIDGKSRSKLKPISYNVLIENVSVSWSVDEAFSLWFAGTSHVTIRNCIVAEALNNAGHPKGQHSMGLLLGSGTGPSQVTGNLLANNRYRNPVIGQGATAYIANNYVVNPGQDAIHSYNSGSPEASRATIVNNVIQAGPDTQPKLFGVLLRPSNSVTVKNEFYLDGNQDVGFGPAMKKISDVFDIQPVQLPPISASDWTLLPTSDVKAYVLKHAGTRPADRDPVDARLLQQIATGTERIIDHPEDAGPLPQIAPTVGKADLPDRPLEVSPKIGKTRLELWLCLKHLELGGVQSRSCPENSAALKQALAS
jgi:hypothetical protein